MRAQTQILDAGDQAGKVELLACHLQLAAIARLRNRTSKLVESLDIIGKPGKHGGVKDIRKLWRHRMETSVTAPGHALCPRKRARHKPNGTICLVMRQARIEQRAAVHNTRSLRNQTARNKLSKLTRHCRMVLDSKRGSVQDTRMALSMRIVAVERHHWEHYVCRSVTRSIKHLGKRLRRKPLVGIHGNNLRSTRCGKASTQARSTRRILDVNQIDMNIPAGGNFERMAHTRSDIATHDDNLQIIEVLVLDALERTHRIAGRTFYHKDHRKSRMRTTSNQVFRPLDSNESNRGSWYTPAIKAIRHRLYCMPRTDVAHAQLTDERCLRTVRRALP